MMWALAAAAAICSFTVASAQGDACKALKVQKLPKELTDAGASLATYVCDPERGGAEDTAQTIAMAAARATAAAAAACDVGGIDTSGTAASSAMVALMADGFAESQNCDCAGAADTLQLPGEQLVSKAIGSADKAAVMALSKAKEANSYVTDLAQGMAGFEGIVSSAAQYADSYCEPRAGDLLDQSFTCGELTAGNETELAFAAGMEAAAYACGHTSANATNATMPTPQTFVQGFAKALAYAVDEAERICTIGDSRVECTLTDDMVAQVAEAQLSAVSKELSATPCGCNISMNMTAMEPLVNLVQNNTVVVHAEGCQYGTNAPDDAALALYGRLVRPVGRALQRVVARSDCPGSPNQPWEACANTEDVNFIPEFTGCCTDGFQCVVKNKFYAQCRDTVRPLPEGWNGTVIECERSQ